ncbi:hypothetical protein KH5_06930 [Urechidicola sp. KH5]
MKKYGILLIALLLLSYVGFSQKTTYTKTKITKVADFKIETDNFEELTSFDWASIHEIFENNNPEETITLAFVYTNKAEKEEGDDVYIDNLEFKVTGKSSEIDKLTKQMSKTLSKISKLETRTR